MIAVAILAIFFISGCGECKSNSDCDTKACFNVGCENKKCVETAVPDCCGNLRCESKENECICPKDCGECEGAVGKYLTKSCKDNECAVDIDESQIKSEVTSHAKELRGFEITVKVMFDQPFDLDRSTVNFEAEMVNKESTTLEPKITKVQLTAIINKQTVILGEKDINKIFWNIGSKVGDNINIDYDFGAAEFETPVTVKVFYEYTEHREGKEDSPIRNSYEQKMKSNLIFVNPERELICDPAVDCNDNNECTIDSCVAGKLLCQHTKKQNCCGNYECEAGENKGSCPIDCGSCEGQEGSYLEYKEEDGECSLVIKEGIIQTKTLSSTKEVADFTLTIKTSFEQPFNIKSGNFDVKLQLDDVDETKAQLPVAITRVQLLESELLIGEVEQNLRLTAVGKSVNPSISADFPMEGHDSEKDITLRVYYSYDKIKTDGTAVTTRNSFDVKLADEVIFVNPSQNE
ncbi:hypothetical protein J4209_02150 [Candidatus Woesearchaeota archaeon]|nr:hypothetical protein [Candidatus Woesearchaeota archaeon]